MNLRASTAPCSLCGRREPDPAACARCSLRIEQQRPYTTDQIASMGAAAVARHAQDVAEEARRQARAARLATLGRPVRVALLGCGSAKQAGRHPARELYTGNLFRVGLAHALATADEVLVLSAQHGLVDLDREIESYDLRLGQLLVSERQRWSGSVVSSLAASYPAPLAVEVTVYAGAEYADEVGAARRFNAVTKVWGWSEPLRKLQVGQRLAWFKKQGLGRQEQQRREPPSLSHVRGEAT